MGAHQHLREGTFSSKCTLIWRLLERPERPLLLQYQARILALFINPHVFIDYVSGE